MIIEINSDNIKTFSSSLLSCDEVNSYFSLNPFAKIVGYLKDNMLVGYLYFSDIYDRAEINQITVLTKYRGMGIGSLLMEYIVSRYSNISLEVSSLNNVAIKLYEKYGFKKVAVRRGYYDGVDGYLMIKE